MSYVCPSCGTSSERGALPGSGAIELVLWLFALLPGVIYSLWRRGGQPACPSCGHRPLLDANTPIGRTLAKHATPTAEPSPPGRSLAGGAMRLLGLTLTIFVGAVGAVLLFG